MPPKRKADGSSVSTASRRPPPSRVLRRPRVVGRSGRAELKVDEGDDDGPESDVEEAKSAASSAFFLSPPASPSAGPSPPPDDETADEQRVRLTKAYIRHIRRTAGEEKEGKGEGEEEEEEEEDEEEMEDVVSHRLVKDAEAASIPRQRRPLAERLRLTSSTSSPPSSSSSTSDDGALPSPRVCRGHRLSVTCTVLRSDDRVAYSASKDGSVIEWEVETGRRLCRWRPRGDGGEGGKAAILGLALSSDGRFLATGGAEGGLRVFDTRQRGDRPAQETKEAVEAVEAGKAKQRPAAPPPLWCHLPANRSAVTALAFRHSTAHLFSGSADRTVKLFDMEAKAYVETLFGHTEGVTGLDSLYRNRAVSVGADRTARMWKVAEESQLLFRVDPSLVASSASSASSVSLDAVALLDDEHFVTGGDEGAVHLWSAQRKRPLQSLTAAHGEGHWVVSLASAPYSDAVFSGSSDGHINCYRWRPTAHTPHSSSSSSSPPAKLPPLQLLGRVGCLGYVNSLSVSHSGRFLVAGLGQEHRAGRWTPTIKAARNGIAIVPLLADGDAALDPLPGDLHRFQR